jgi:hypothetical protein
MHNAFEAIDPVTLAHVTGGESGSGSSTHFAGNVGVTVPTDAGDVQVGMQASYDQKKSAYVHCIDKVGAMPGATPQSLRETCGLPPSGP